MIIVLLELPIVSQFQLSDSNFHLQMEKKLY